MRENSWKEISVFMNMPADNCQNRWLRLRERFTKEQRLQEIDTRSGNAASRRPVFLFYNNMMFLKKFIRRRKSYSNVTNSPIKKRAVDMSNVYTDEDSSTKDTSSHHSLDIGTDSSRLCSTSSNIVPEEVEITSRTNFSRNQRFQKINKSQAIQNMADSIRISQEINTIENCDPLSPLLRSESRNSCNMSQSTSIVSPTSCSPILQTVPSNTKKFGKINRNTTYLESSITSLTNTLQNRLANPPLTGNNNTHTFDLINNLTPEKSFGLLIAVELEKIPEPEKSKRKRAIAQIIWEPLT